MDIFTLILMNMVYQQHQHNIRFMHIEITHLLHQEFFYTKKINDLSTQATFMQRIAAIITLVRQK
jgi:hypothetical protein